MMRITLKQLRYFDALAEHRHFGRAAVACAISQPALSMQIQDLEADLGVALIERGRSGVTLTGIGHEIAGRARRILGEVHDLADCARHAALLTGALRIGMIPTVAPYVLPGLLQRLAEEYPALSLQLRESQTATLLHELAAHKLDVALLALPVEGAEVETMPLYDDRFVLAVPRGYDCGEGGPVAADIIARERLLLLEEGHCLRDQALSYCEPRNAAATQTLGLSSLSTIVRMVATGHGVTLLPEISMPVETPGSDVRLIAFDPPAPSRMLGLVWRQTSPRREDFEELGRLLIADHDMALERKPGAAG